MDLPLHWLRRSAGGCHGRRHTMGNQPWWSNTSPFRETRPLLSCLSRPGVEHIWTPAVSVRAISNAGRGDRSLHFSAASPVVFFRTYRPCRGRTHCPSPTPDCVRFVRTYLGLIRCRPFRTKAINQHSRKYGAALVRFLLQLKKKNKYNRNCNNWIGGCFSL